MSGDSDLGRAPGFRPRAQARADHAFQLADSWLHQGLSIVPGLLLPTPASMLGDALERPIALVRLSLSARSLSIAVDCGGTIMAAPVGQPVSLPGNAITSGGIGFERRGRHLTWRAQASYVG